jgi:hypothetical protein
MLPLGRPSVMAGKGRGSRNEIVMLAFVPDQFNSMEEDEAAIFSCTDGEALPNAELS